MRKQILMLTFIIAGSHITKAWRSYIEELENTSKQIKSNAELLDTVCQDRLTQLYQDKRKARKQYQEEHSRIATQFSHVSTISEKFPSV